MQGCGRCLRREPEIEHTLLISTNMTTSDLTANPFASYNLECENSMLTLYAASPNFIESSIVCQKLSLSLPFPNDSLSLSLPPPITHRTHTPCSIANANQIIRKLLHHLGCFAGLYGFGVVCDEDGLLRLDDENAFSALFVVTDVVISVVLIMLESD